MDNVPAFSLLLLFVGSRGDVPAFSLLDTAAWLLALRDHLAMTRPAGASRRKSINTLADEAACEAAIKAAALAGVPAPAPAAAEPEAGAGGGAAGGGSSFGAGGGSSFGRRLGSSSFGKQALSESVTLTSDAHTKTRHENDVKLA